MWFLFMVAAIVMSVLYISKRDECEKLKSQLTSKSSASALKDNAIEDLQRSNSKVRGEYKVLANTYTVNSKSSKCNCCGATIKIKPFNTDKIYDCPYCRSRTFLAS